MMPEAPNPTAIGHGVLYLIPAIMLIYLGLWLPTIHRIPRLTVMGIALLLVLDRAVLAAHWFAIAFGGNVSRFVGSTEVIYTINLLIATFLFFAWRERRCEEDKGDDV